MSKRYHVYKSENDDPDDGGTYELAQTFQLKAHALALASRLLDAGQAVQILPVDLSDA